MSGAKGGKVKKVLYLCIAAVAAIQFINISASAQNVADIAKEIKQLTRQVALKEKRYQGLTPQELKQYQDLKLQALGFSSQDEVYSNQAKIYLYYKNRHGTTMEQQLHSVQDQLIGLYEEISQLLEENGEMAPKAVSPRGQSLSKSIHALFLRAKKLQQSNNIKLYEEQMSTIETLFKRKRNITKNIKRLFEMIKDKEKNNPELELLETKYFNSVCSIRNKTKQSIEFQLDKTAIDKYTKRILSEARATEWVPKERLMLSELINLRGAIYYYINMFVPIGSTAEIQVDPETIRLSELVAPVEYWQFRGSLSNFLFTHHPKLLNRIYQY